MKYFKLLLSATILLLLAAALLWRSCDSNSTGNLNTQSDATSETQTQAQAQFVKQVVDPPLGDSYQPLQQHEIDVQQGGHLSFPSGTEIDIPAQAFIYPNGEPVTGKVIISFREFHTAAEVLLSGIPMRDWDDNTQSWQNFSTAGMFEVRGTDEYDHSVEIAPNRPLEVRLASRVEGTYDTWYFDEEKGDWERQGQNTGTAFTPAPTTRSNSESGLPPRPTPPVQYDSEAIRVAFAGMNLADFPEINDPDNIALQYAGTRGDESDPEENEWIFTANWFKAELSKTAKKGVYQLYLENDDEAFTTQVRGTLLPDAYSVALEEYQQQVAAYEAAVRNLEQTRQRVAQVLRTMEVGRFGMYNYDIYGRWQEPVFAQADFLPAGKDAWSILDQVYLITDEGQITVRYPKSNWNMFNFDRSRKNLIVGITSDLEIVVLSPDDFVNQSANLAASDREQQWNCTLNEQVFKLEDPANLQRVIDVHFAG